MDYVGGVAPIVTTFGPGNLHHIAYDPNTAGFRSVIGFIPTTNELATNFVLGFSYGFNSYAFYWDGAGDAFWRLGNSSLVEPVGNSWANATGVPFNGEVILGVNVESQVASSVNNGDGRIVVYVVPGGLD
ncbi:hypothetical protein FB45DRAFT_278011 [Roridomyces roridus]|uniref:Uncharacterized protein n=1 Tax=Roridomyces roridus TaxID=1738132 RepID=A0AAD7FXE5_9AGAR|nr:hypothetical protein FB45DRAFT_278011 [Roridomyces roridus]